MRTNKEYVAADLFAWLEKTRREKTDKGKPRWKKAQVEMVEIIVRRMLNT